MNEINVSTLKELQKALQDGNIPVVIGDITFQTEGVEAPHIIVTGNGVLSIAARGSSQPRIEAWGSSQPRIEAWESSQPIIVAGGSSQPRIKAGGSSQPRIEAWESSQPRIEAGGSSQPIIEAWGSSQPIIVARGSSQPRIVARGYVQLCVKGAVTVIAEATVAICVLGGMPQIQGGGFISYGDQTTPAAWCAYYDVKTEGEYALLFKAVNHEYKSNKGFLYAVGTVPEAPDWDGGNQECGRGLHFSPCPSMARVFFSEATKYMACPVLLKDMAVHPEGEFPEKCKAKRVALPCWEVDVEGQPVAGAVVTWPLKE